MGTVRELKRERVSMLLVEQNAEMALGLADRVYVIDHGTIVFEGTPAALRAERAGHHDLPRRRRLTALAALPPLVTCDVTPRPSDDVRVQ